MDRFNQIQIKLHGFIRKYYTNELIKGAILFISFGVLYFLFTLLVEHFLWLKPSARTVLFWVFILVEILLLVNYLVIPVFKLIGFSKGISLSEASKLIGKHFPTIDDKLLNMLQLHNSNLNTDSNQSTELILASIDQKAENLQPIPFQKAIQFSSNKKYLKYLLIPIGIWLLTILIGKKEVFSDSYNRVLHHQQAYIPPAPFTFMVLNNSLDVIEGNPIYLQIQINGDVIPSEPKIVFNDEDYFLRYQGGNHFYYEFAKITAPIRFYLEANSVVSKTYDINPIPTPKIQGISMYLNYPNYVSKSDEIVKNTGSISVPTGTSITWNIDTQQTDSLNFISNSVTYPFKATSDNHNLYSFKKNIRQSLTYNIQASNSYLKNYENLTFTIDVVQDEYPTIHIETDIDSISRGEAQFIGNLSDDYGLSKLKLVYYLQNYPANKQAYQIDIQRSVLTNFYYSFPSNLNLEKGLDYEFYFEVFDNDAVSGPKSAKSRAYSYHKDTQHEAQEKFLQEEKDDLQNLEKSLEKKLKIRKDLDKFKKKLQNKSSLEFNDTKQLKNFLQRQTDYQEMMQRQTDKLQRNLNDQPNLDNPDLLSKKQEIQKRIQDAAELAKQDKLLEELQKMAEKLKKEDLLDRLKKMSKNNKQQEKSLEQLLELTKRFYVEQKAEQIRQKLEELAQKQEKLSKSDDNSKEKQEELTKDFKDIQKDMEQLQKDNKELKQPMDIDEQKSEQHGVEEDQQKASEQLEQQNEQQASKKQQSAANKMKQMAKIMQSQMAAMQGDMIEEDIALLRNILENLLTFSFKQENLMITLSNMHSKHPSFAEKLKDQHHLKTFFEHIDDSLYTLALRQVKLSPLINEYLTDAHYYIDETIVHYADNQINRAISDQQYVMTNANNLALLLSSLLDNMQSTMKGMGKGGGKGKQGQSFGLIDIIQQQGEMIKKTQKGMKQNGEKPGGKEGKTGGASKSQSKGSKQGDGEESSQALYEIYKQQVLLRQALESQLNGLEDRGLKPQANKVKMEMEALEQMLLDKGITNDVIKRMLHLEHELLKLKEARQQQGQESKRQSQSNRIIYPTRSPKQIEFKKRYYDANEILIRESLPISSQFKKKIKDYFKQTNP